MYIVDWRVVSSISTADVNHTLMSWIAKAYSFQRHVRDTFVKKLAQAIEIGTNYIMMQIVSLAFRAKKTWINPGSLTPAIGAPAI